MLKSFMEVMLNCLHHSVLYSLRFFRFFFTPLSSYYEISNNKLINKFTDEEYDNDNDDGENCSKNVQNSYG